MRIAVGGFQHETNSFASVKAGYEQFETADGWPGLSRGAALAPALVGINLPAGGFLAAATAAGHQIAPLLWCSASPSAPVTDDAFERITAMLVADLRAAGPVDAVYLDLHGAMVTESVPDGEGEILARIRAVTGPDIPIVASLDLHANVTQRMVDLSDLLVPYRTYPHVDMAETGARAAALLDRILSGWRPKQGVPAGGVPGLAGGAVHAVRPGAPALRADGRARAPARRLARLLHGFPGGGFRRLRPQPGRLRRRSRGAGRGGGPR